MSKTSIDTALTLKERLRHLYEDHGGEACRFRYTLFAIDLLVIAFIIVTSFMERAPWIVGLDVVCGLIVAADFGARMWISQNRLGELKHWGFWVDILTLASFLAPLGGEGAGFLRIMRTLRLLHTYQMLNRLRIDSPYFRRHEEVILATVHMSIFLFVMTAIVYETQHYSNKQIANYADALYFTVTALTTTGFGDITLPGLTGRMISVVIMLFGVTLFLRLAQVMFRPTKVRFSCPNCGLSRHEHDAVHCKACGVVLNIPDDND
jgi:voltage-gated potassium channel